MKKRSQIILRAVLLSTGLFIGSQMLSINAKTTEASVSDTAEIVYQPSDSVKENYPYERNCEEFRNEEVFCRNADSTQNNAFAGGRQYRKRANCQNQENCLRKANCQNQRNCLNQQQNEMQR